MHALRLAPKLRKGQVAAVGGNMQGKLQEATCCQHTAHKIDTMARPISLFSVNAILVLSVDDNSRILTKYYQAPHPPLGTPAHSTNYPGANPYPNVKDQKAFEKGLLEKTTKQV